MLRRLRLGPKLTLLILLTGGALLVILLATLHRDARRLLEDELRDRAGHLTRATTGRMEVVLRGAEKVVEELAVALGLEARAPEAVYGLLEETLRRHEELFGCAFARIPVSTGSARAPCRYVHRSGASLERKDLSDPQYQLERQEWLTGPVASRRAAWSEPYLDAGGGDTNMVTYSVPILSPDDGSVRGVVTGDLSLRWLHGLLASLPFGPGGHAFVVSRQGTFLAHSRNELRARETMVSLAQKTGRPELERVWQRMQAGESGFLELDGLLRPERMWLAFGPVAGTGWSLGTMHPRQTLVAKLADLRGGAVLVAIVGLALLCLAAFAIAQTIARPITALEASAKAIAGGDLDAAVPSVPGRDEVSSLARSFARMRSDLKKHIAELKESTASQARLDRDLALAQEIQSDLVPRQLATDPPRTEYTLHALLDPAREIGGDFYQFFLRGRDQLFFAVGDASGKGIPAALYMAQATTLLSSYAKRGASPTDALASVNASLAERNEAAMFMTIFCGVLDLRSGRCRHACGGHPPPYILRQDGAVEPVGKQEGPVLGSSAGATFAEAELQLEPGDTLVAFSDGVPEAQSRGKELFGEERIAAVLAGLRGATPEAIVAALRRAVAEFEAGAPQADDITILAIAYHGRRST